MRTTRAKIDGAAYYSVMNRILERRYILKEDVAGKVLSLMPQVESFSGVQVVTYCVMTNHVHLLLRVPERKVLSDSEMRTNAERGTRSAERKERERGTRSAERGAEEPEGGAWHSEGNDGAHGEVKAGFAPDSAGKVFEEKGMLQSWVLAGYRLLWSTEGAGIGSTAYVREFRTAKSPVPRLRPRSRRGRGGWLGA